MTHIQQSDRGCSLAYDYLTAQISFHATDNLRVVIELSNLAEQALVSYLVHEAPTRIQAATLCRYTPRGLHQRDGFLSPRSSPFLPCRQPPTSRYLHPESGRISSGSASVPANN